MKKDFWQVVKTARVICEALDDLRDAVGKATDGLFDIYHEGEDWDGEPLDNLRTTLLDAESDLLRSVEVELKPYGLSIRFNRLYGRFFVHE